MLYYSDSKVTTMTARTSSIEVLATLTPCVATGTVVANGMDNS